MPLTITPVTSNLDASILDGNFEELRARMTEQVLGSDFPDPLVSWKFRKNSFGKISSATLQAEMITDSLNAYSMYWFGEYDLNFRRIDGSWSRNSDAPVDLRQKHFTMEYLGKPGPSFYWDFQEEGLKISDYGITGSAEVNQWPTEYCYSYWLTVPGCTKKIYVPEKCAVKVNARAFFLAPTTYGTAFLGNRTGVVADNVNTWKTLAAEDINAATMRIGLFVDTNPVLYTDEFANTNQNIHPPGLLTTAPYCSWKKITETSVVCPLWQREDLTGAVVLQGGRWYNFSMKYRGAGYLGYSNGGAFADGIWDANVGHGAATPNDWWSAGLGTPPFEVLWVSTSLHLEFFYGYSSLVDDATHIGAA